MLSTAYLKRLKLAKKYSLPCFLVDFVNFFAIKN